MHMVAHDDISPNAKTLKRSTILKAIDDDVPIDFSSENIHPIDDCKRQKVNSVLMVDAIARGHLINVGQPQAFIRS